MTATESIRWCHGRDGIELMQAALDQHVYDRHIHESYAIGVTLRGVQRFWCRGAIRDSTPGHVIVINPGETHDGRSGASGGYAYRMFYIPVTVFETCVEEVPGHPSDFSVPHPLVLDPGLSRQLDAAWRVMARSSGSLAADELFHRALNVLAARHMEHGPLRPASRHDRVLNQIRDYLHDRIEQSVTMRELSGIASLSRFQLTRLFQKAYGLPLHAYHLHLRLEEAKRRLRAGQAIAAVAADLGFVDQSHLHRRFKGWFGMTPGQWRAAHGYKTPGRAWEYSDPDGTHSAARRSVAAI